MTPLTRRITQAQIDAYAEASGDHNPIHVNDTFARSVGLPGTIAHGMLSMAIMTEAVSRWCGGHENVLSIACRFSKPLFPGDALICRGRVTAVDLEESVATLDLEGTSDRGDRVLVNAHAQVRL